MLGLRTNMVEVCDTIRANSVATGELILRSTKKTSETHISARVREGVCLLELSLGKGLSQDLQILPMFFGGKAPEILVSSARLVIVKSIV